MRKVFSFLLALVMIIGLFPISVVVDAATYTECASGTVSWQMIYDNPNTYYWKHDGDYYVLTARKSSKDYYVTLYRKSELCYLKQDKDDDSDDKHEWDSSSSKYTGGKLYTKGTSQTGTLANKTYSGISDLSYRNGGAAYKIKVDFTVSNGKVTAFTVTPVVEGGGSMDEVNKKYFDDAVEGVTNQVLNKTAYKDLDNMIDAVSGATCSSDLIRDAVNVSINGSVLSGGGEVEVPTDSEVYVYKGTSDSAFTKKDEDYKVYVEVRVVDGNIISVQTTGIRTKDNKNITDAKNVACLNKATAGISNSVVKKAWNDETVSGIDTISGATYSSNLIKEAMGNALGGDNSRVYVLVSAPTSGKKYIIANRNTSGSGYMMNSSFDDNKTGIVSVNVQKDSSKYSGQPYITLSSDTNALTFTGTTSSFTLKNKSGTKLNGKSSSATFKRDSDNYIKESHVVFVLFSDCVIVARLFVFFIRFAFVGLGCAALNLQSRHIDQKHKQTNNAYKYTVNHTGCMIIESYRTVCIRRHLYSHKTEIEQLYLRRLAVDRCSPPVIVGNGEQYKFFVVFRFNLSLKAFVVTGKIITGEFFSVFNEF